MSRAGFTMLETMATIVLLTLVLNIGVTAVGALERTARSSGQEPLMVDLACEALRRDLAHGARLAGDDLVAGKARWRVVKGTLTRDGAPRCRVGACAWTIESGAVVVRLSAPGLPPREVRAWR